MKFDIYKETKRELRNKGGWYTIKSLPSKEIRDFLQEYKTAGLPFKLLSASQNFIKHCGTNSLLLTSLALTEQITAIK